jgi:drug/metabolite transporter (DMT)-like permease
MGASPAPALTSRPGPGVWAALLVQTAISAGTYLVAKRAMRELTPLTLLLCRFLISAIALIALLALVRGRKLPPREALPAVLGLGLLAGPVNQGCFFFGLSRSLPAHAALLYALTPIGVLAYERLRSGERVSRLVLAGIVVAFAGVVVLLLGRGLRAASGPLFGDLFILVAVGAWVIYTAEGKGLVARHGFFRATAWTMTTGGLVAFPVAPFLLDARAVLAASQITHFAIFYLALLTSVVSYFLWYYALGKLSASRVAIFSNLQPVATALAAWAFLGDPLTWEIAVGGGLVLVGVRLAQAVRRVPI